MFEIHVGELRATFLRNHNMRRRKDPKRKTTQAQKTSQAEDNPSSEDPHNPDNRHKHGGAAPVTWRCTRYVAVHPLRGAAPEQKRCIAYGSGAVPQHTRTNAELTRPIHSLPHPSMRNWALLAAGWARRPRRHLHSSPLRPNPTPPTPLHAKSRLTPPTVPRRNGSEPIARQAGQPAGFSETSARTRLGPSAVARVPRYWGRHAKQPMVRWSCAGVRLRHVMSMSVGVGLAVVMT